MSHAPTYDVTAYGEAMVRLSVPAGRYLVNATSLDLNVGGAESNVCSVLAQLGRNAGWFSALPNSPLGNVVISRLRQAGVDTRGVHLHDQGRVGVYYLESAHPPLSSTVEYDRAGSAVTQHDLTAEQLARMLNTRIVHLTGITPALGPKPRAAVEQIMNHARTAGATVSFDVNYRERLWSVQGAVPVISSLIERANIVFCNLRDAVRLFGSQANAESAVATLKSLTAAELIVVSLGEQGAIANHNGVTLTAPAVPTKIVDRPGAGDALAGGVLDSYLNGDVQGGLDAGVTLASIALSHHGDMVFADRTLVNATTQSRGSDISR